MGSLLCIFALGFSLELLAQHLILLLELSLAGATALSLDVSPLAARRLPAF